MDTVKLISYDRNYPYFFLRISGHNGVTEISEEHAEIVIREAGLITEEG